MRAGIEPGHAAAHDFDIKHSTPEVLAVNIGDLQFATC